MKARLALLLALCFALFRCWYVGRIDLAPDEAYYWEWSRSLDWSYYDQGPGLALAIRLGTALLGHTELGVRFMSILSGLGVSALSVWFCVKVFDAEELCVWMVLAFNTMLLFSVGGILMMHDSLLGLFWMAALAGVALAVKAATSGVRLAAWIGVGLCAACALISKYTGVLLFASVGLALIFEPRLRSRLLWVALLLGACGGLPLLIWNSQNGWPSLKHVSALAGGDPSFRHWHAAPAYLASQFGVVSPVLMYLVLLAWREAWTRFRLGAATAVENLLFFGSLPVFLFFMVLSVRTLVGPNWPAPAYLGGLLLAGLYLKRNGKLQGSMARWALGLSLAFSVTAHVQAAWPFLPVPQKWAKLDTASRVDGWKELGARVYDERMKMQAPSASLRPGSQIFVACLTYQYAAELAFYQKDQPRSLILRGDSINNQYCFWNDPAAHVGQSAILVFGQDWELEGMARCFKKIERLPDEIFFRHGIEVRRTHLVRAYQFDPVRLKAL